MNNMEIKVGDKVRVREDAPRVYVAGVHNIFKYHVSEVVATEDDNARIRFTDIGVDDSIAIPTKYLVKIEEEKKEGKFKVGDKVIFIPTGKVKVVSRINANSLYAVTVTEPNDQSPLCVRETELAPYIEHNAPKFKVGDRVRNVKSDLCGIALNIEHGIVEVGIPYNKEKHYWNTDIVELFEPTEQTEAEKNDADNLKKVAEEWANTVCKAIKEYGDAMCKIYVEAHNEAFWDAYTAELAKEVALKVANKFNAPHEAAEYAVSVAKAVVEGLKRE